MTPAASLLTPLFTFLKCVLAWLGGLIVAGVLGIVNLVIAGVMALVTLALSILPSVDLASVQVPALLAWANWLFPLDQFVIATTVVVAVLAVWPLVAMLLRWAKGVE